MNKQQRNALSDAAAALEALVGVVPETLAQLRDTIELIKPQLSTVESTRDEEQEKLDNMPESLQSSSKAEAFEEAVENLYCAAEALNEAVELCREDVTEDRSMEDIVSDLDDKIEEALDSIRSVV